MRELKFQMKIHAFIIKMWNTWTDSDTITKGFSPHANIEPRLGGAYEYLLIPPTTITSAQNDARLPGLSQYTH
jgi:uncharacterized protein YndB with AHSA1/START domain